MLSKIHRLKKQKVDKEEINMFGYYLLHEVKVNLKKEFSNSINDYWSTRLSNISLHDNRNMFPEINKIFKSQKPSSISQLKIPFEKKTF